MSYIYSSNDLDHVKPGWAVTFIKHLGSVVSLIIYKKLKFGIKWHSLHQIC